MLKKKMKLALSTILFGTMLLSPVNSVAKNTKNKIPSFPGSTYAKIFQPTVKGSLDYPFNEKTRKFIKQKIPEEVSRKISANQLIEINLPAYKLTLYSKDEKGEITDFSIPIAIGKGAYGKRQTPISVGIAYEKRESINFRYGKSYPALKIEAGDIIKWTNTFDEEGNPIGYRIPYKKMRGIGMKLWKKKESAPFKRFVIHSTTDEFTLGTAASSGCLRVGTEDMLSLYEKFSPETKTYKVETPVPVIISYDLIERLKNNKIVLHANIYDKDKNLFEEFQKIVSPTEFPKGINKTYISSKFSEYTKEFPNIHSQILKRYDNSFPKNYQDKDAKKRLHKIFTLEELSTN